MQIWYRRPLFCICTALMVGTVGGYLSHLAGLPIWLIALIICGICASAIGGTALISILLRKYRRSTSRVDRIRTALVSFSLLCAVAVTAGLWGACFGASAVNETSFASIETDTETMPETTETGAETVTDTEPATDIGRETDEESAPEYSAESELSSAPLWVVKAVVRERLSGGNQITVYGLDVESVNGESVRFAFRACRAVLYCDYCSDLQAGYTVFMTVRAVPLDEAAGVMTASLTGDGYTVGLLSDSETDCTVLNDEPTDLRGKLDALRRRVAAQLDLLTGDGAFGLPSALLLGERGSLADTVQRDFRRIGVSHLLAISGLHVTILFGLLALFLKKLTVPRPVRAGILLVLSVSYLTFLGFPPSATRSVMMLGIVCLSWLWQTAPDPLTSLGVAGAAILLVSPFAATDAGFWMSFSATFGLVTVMPLFPLPAPAGWKDSLWVSVRKTLQRRTVSVAIGLCTGVTAASFSLWMTASVFGFVSMWSPLATVILTPLCSFVLIVTPFALCLGGTGVGEAVILPALRTVCGWMADVAARLSDTDIGMLSLHSPASTVIILCMTVSLLILLGVRLPKCKRWAVCLPIVCGWLLLFGAAGISAHLHADEVTVTYCAHTSARSEAILLTNGQSAVICDLSDGSRTAMSAVLQYAAEEGAVDVDALILTQYNSRLIGTLWHVCSTEKIHTVYMPRPMTEKDSELAQSVYAAVTQLGVDTVMYDAEKEADGTIYEPIVLWDSVTVSLCKDMLKRSAQHVILLSVETEQNRIVYLGRAVFESSLSETATRWLAAREPFQNAVICGNKGPLLKQEFSLPSDCPAAVLCFANDTVLSFCPPESRPACEVTVGDFRMVFRIGKIIS